MPVGVHGLPLTCLQGVLCAAPWSVSSACRGRQVSYSVLSGCSTRHSTSFASPCGVCLPAGPSVGHPSSARLALQTEVPALQANAIQDTVLPCAVAGLQQLGSSLTPPRMSPTRMSVNSVPADLASRDNMWQCQKGWPAPSDGLWTQDQANCLQVKGAEDLERAACHALLHINPAQPPLFIVPMPATHCMIHWSSQLPADEGGGGPGAPPPAPAALL